jgi:hypothetical protein
LSDPGTLKLSTQRTTVSGSSPENPSVAASNGDQKTSANEKKRNRKPKASNASVAGPAEKDAAIVVAETEKVETPILDTASFCILDTVERLWIQIRK